MTTPGETQMQQWSSEDEPFGLGPLGTMLIGAAAGLLFGYVFLTDGGRRLRSRLGPMLDAWSDELRRLRDTAEKARSTINEGRDSFAAVKRVTHAPRDSY